MTVQNLSFSGRGNAVTSLARRLGVSRLVAEDIITVGGRTTQGLPRRLPKISQPPMETVYASYGKGRLNVKTVPINQLHVIV